VTYIEGPFYRYEIQQLKAWRRGRLADVHHANGAGTMRIATVYTLRMKPKPGETKYQYPAIVARTLMQSGEEYAMEKWLETHAPKIDPRSVRVNIMFHGEPHAWQRPTQPKFGRWRLIDTNDNGEAKEMLRRYFDWAYPKWQMISQRNLGIQLYFRTLYDSKDASNLQKLVEDAFNLKIWTDDRQIKETYTRVQVANDKPFTQLVVYLLDAR
jgi:Holliday junction resolvase RusA-like endonuclease